MPKAIVITISILGGIVLLVLLVSVVSNSFFNQKVTKEISQLFANNTLNNDQLIIKSDLKGLPVPVQKWLEYSQVIGKERISTVRLKQKAMMRMNENQGWMPVQAEQYFTTAQPGFVWKARIKAAPLFYIVGRDKYEDGKGNMLIKLLSVITVADSKGKEIDQGTLLRYLAETVWFPTAVLSNYIKWEEIDSRSAKATMSFGGISASGVFTFNEQGEVINFVAERYREFEGQYELNIWTILMREYQEFNGIRIPTEGDVIWKLETGDFNWFQFEITEIEYNKPLLY